MAESREIAGDAEGDQDAARDLAGVPLEAAGYALRWIELDDVGQIVARYDRAGASRRISLATDPDGAAEGGDEALRAQIAAARRRARAPALPDRVAFDPEGIAALLPELSLGLPSGWRLRDRYRGRAPGEVALELGQGSAQERLVVEVRGAPGRLRIQGRMLGPDAREDPGVRDDSAFAFAVTSFLLRLRAPSRCEPSRSGRPLEARPPPRIQLLVGRAPPDAHATQARGLDAMEASAEPSFATEARLLRPTLDAAARYFGAAPAVARLEDASVEAWTITFAPVPATLRAGPTFFHPADHALRERAVMGAYLSALGYRVHDDGLIRTVPTPRSLLALLEARGAATPGMRPRLIAVDTWRVPEEAWLDGWLDGELGLSVGSGTFYRWRAWLARARTPNRYWCEHLTAVGHDMSTHALATHRVPTGDIAALGERLRPLVRRLRDRGRDDALDPLVAIYEEDLVRECFAIWETVADPGDFPVAWARGARLDAIVEERVAQAEAIAARPRATAHRLSRLARRVLP